MLIILLVKHGLDLQERASLYSCILKPKNDELQPIARKLVTETSMFGMQSYLH